MSQGLKEDFKYLGNLLEVGKTEDGLEAASSVQTVYQCAVVKRELTIKGKLLIYWQINVPSLAYSHEFWVTDQKNKIVDTGGEAFSKKKVEKLVIREGSEGSRYVFA